MDKNDIGTYRLHRIPKTQMRSNGVPNWMKSLSGAKQGHHARACILSWDSCEDAGWAQFSTQKLQHPAVIKDLSEQHMTQIAQLPAGLQDLGWTTFDLNSLNPMLTSWTWENNCCLNWFNTLRKSRFRVSYLGLEKDTPCQHQGWAKPLWRDYFNSSYKEALEWTTSASNSFNSCWHKEFEWNNSDTIH